MEEIDEEDVIFFRRTFLGDLFSYLLCLFPSFQPLIVQTSV